MVDSLMQMRKFIEIATKFSIYRNIFERLSRIAYRLSPNDQRLWLDAQAR